MLVPMPRLLWMAALLTALGLAASVTEALELVWLAAIGALVAVATFDAAMLHRLPSPAVARLVPGSLPLGVAHEVTLRLVNPAPVPVTLAVHDHHPGGAEVEGLPRTLTLPAQGWGELAYRFKPVQRGELAFGRVEMRVVSTLQLWAARRYAGDAASTRVYPNFAALTRFALLATAHRLAQIGVRERRRRGEGLDFRQLREYREGDIERQIDWKATARTGKLISREYQEERDQTLVLLIDCGRRMAAKDGALSHFDHVLNAALLLAFVALRQGDAVGFLTMSGAERWLAPRKSRATLNLVLNGLYDLEPSLATTDYHSAAIDLMTRVRKRALVVILSNMRDEDDDTLAPALALLQSRHLVLFASLREQLLSRALAARVDDFDRALTHAAAAEYLARRSRAFRRIARGGAVTLDVEPQQLPIAIVNRYIDIKRAGRL